MSDIQAVEIKGVKFDIDMRQAVRVETLQVGSRVRVLDNNSYGSKKVHTGVIVGFEPFHDLPTIIVAYIEDSYGKADLKFVHWNTDTEKVDIVAAVDHDLDLDKAGVEAWFDREITKHEREIEDIQAKREYFRKAFASWFEPIAEEDLKTV